MKALAKKMLAAFACALLLCAPVAANDASAETALSVESITNHQPADMITENLTLDSAYTWTASPEGVVNTETGAVTRDPWQDKTVTLTATRESDTVGTFALTVKSQKTNVLVSDNFAYDYENGTDPLAQSAFPFEHNGNATGDTANPHKIVTETDGNRYLELNFEYKGEDNAKKSAKTAVLKALKDFKYDKTVCVSFKYKHVKGTLGEGETAFENQGSHITALNSKNGTTVLAALAYNNNVFGFKAGAYYDNGYTFSSYRGDGTDAWQRGIIKYDSETHTSYVSKDGVHFTVNRNETLDVVSGFMIGATSSGDNCGKLLIDDLVVYNESSPLTVESITNHQPTDMITKNLTLDSVYTWTASPEGVVNTATGEVTRDLWQDKTVTLTATKDGDSKSFSLVVKSMRTKVLVSDNFAYDYAENTDPLTQSEFPFEHSSASETDSTQQNRILTETDGNRYLQLDMTYSGDDGTKKEAKRTILTALKNFQYNETVYIAFRFKYVSTNKTNGIYFQALQYTTEKHLASLGYNNNDLGFKAGYAYDNGFVYSNYKADGTDAWETGIIKYNLGDKISYVSKDGVNFTANKNGVFDGIQNFRLSPMTIAADCGKLLIDDLVVYTEAEYPAEIAINENRVSVTGATEGGMLVVAQYSNEGNTLVSAKLVTSDFSSVEIGTVESGNTVKCFFWEQNSLRPLAASKSVEAQ